MKEIDKESVELILETHKKQKLGVKRLEKIIGLEHGIRIPHNNIHKFLLEYGLANESKNKRNVERPGSDTNERAPAKFSLFLKENNINYIKGRVKHPQTNGKIEKWYDTYEKYRFKLENFDKSVN